jgi:hypothetical protein
MQYNLLRGASWEINTTEGNVSVEFPELYGLMDYDDGPMLSISGTDLLVIDFDFGYRIHLDRFEYKYDTPYATPSNVASGIEFSYKNESFDDYISLSTYYSGSNIFYTTISGSVFNPRYLRFKHVVANTLNASTISGTVYGFKAFNNDTVVDFGEDGKATSKDIEVVREDIPDIKAIPIYNSGEKLVDAYVNLEPNYTGIDEAISISASPSGPWTYAFNPADLIIDQENFSQGIYDNVHAITNVLRMTGADIEDGYVSTYTEGTYTSKVFRKGTADYNRLVINKSKNSAGFIAVDRGDPIETIEIRSDNTKPKDYLVIIEFNQVANGAYYYYRYRDRWAPSTSVKSVGSQLFFPGERYSRYVEHCIYVDQKSDKYAGCAQNFYQGDSRSNSHLYLFLNDIRADSHKYKRLAYTSSHSIRVDYNWFETKLDYSGGMWVYFYCTSYNAGDFVNNSGYYLAYFDNNLTNTFKYMDAQQQISMIDVDYNTKQVWYTRPSNMAIYRVDHEGYVKVNFSDSDITYDLGGVAVLPDGNLLYANDKDLHRLHNSGYPLPEYDLENVAGDKLTYIVLDPSDSSAVWAFDGSSVGRLYIDGTNRGTWDFKIEVLLAIRMDAVNTGVWVKCAGEEGAAGVIMRYISKENRRIDFEYQAPDRCQPGLHLKDYTDEYYTEKMPLATDFVWGNLDWKKVSLEGYMLSEDAYQQVRITFQAPSPSQIYPEFVVDPDKEFFKDDYFNQGSSTPDQLLWGNWRDKPSLERVYIDTNDQALILVPGEQYDDHAFISTQNRMVLTRDGGGTFEVRLNYEIGDGSLTGSYEYIYIYAHSVQEGFEGKTMGVRLRLGMGLDDKVIFYALQTNGSWNSIGYFDTTSTNWYSGEFAMYWNASNIYASVRPDTSSSWHTASYSSPSSHYGNYFYIQIVSLKDRSGLKLNYVRTYAGTPYYYTATQSITSINQQQLVKVEDVYPNTSKNVYVRTYIPRDLEVSPTSELDMKVRWRIPVY